ncbi:MAG: thrombospondin type 3 repeat-containing protein [Actinomycetota bacterium]|nr:thrombospondin type 3 repeat-containing protein [Actinomycetota bacterium]
MFAVPLVLVVVLAAGGVAFAAPDSDGDGHADEVDNCPTTANPGLTDHDRDGIGTACDGSGDFAPGPCNNHQAGTDGPETLIGAAGGDRMAGFGGDDHLVGLVGDDCLYGQDGDDELAGGDGSDLIKGHDGADRLNGGSGDDSLTGGRGDDVLTGGRGRNAYSAQSGDDVIKARNGVGETVNCGRGQDRAHVDLDDETAGCERVLVIG